MSVVVIKYGGSLLEEPGHRSAFLKDIAALSGKQKVILVHGGGKEISRQMEQAGIQPRFVAGRRYTDDDTMQVVEKALSQLNQSIVKELRTIGIPAEGFSGRHEHLLEANAVRDLGRVGEPSRVDSAALQKLLELKALPVFYTVAEDRDKKPLNINADDFAQALAVACRAERLVFLTDTGGVLDGQGRLIARIQPPDVEKLAQENIITGGMLVKAKACVDALAKGVGSVDIVKGIKYLFDSKGTQAEGTVFSHG